MKPKSPERTSFTLKPLSTDAIEAALGKAEHYRLLNQPRLSESICLDVLTIDPQNQRASRVLVLSLTDQFQTSSRTISQAREMVNQLTDEYERLYYTGIILERLGNAAQASSTPSADTDAYEWYIEAMDYYEQAEAKNKDSKNNDTILRWNTCARTIMQNNLRKREWEEMPISLE